MIFSKAIPNIEKTIGYKFKDKSLLTQAFTRTSFCNEADKKSEYQSNEVLEFLGDSVLSTAIITKLLSEKGERYKHGIKTSFSEGDFSNIKSNLSDKKNLSGSMMRLGLQQFLIMGDGDEKLEIKNEPSVMEDLFESIIGAIYLDCGMRIDTVMSSVSKMLDISAYTTGAAVNRSAKNALQEWCAEKSRRLPVPRYETLEETGPDHKKVYVRACYIGDRLCGRGEGKNFKLADAAAASAALELLEKEDEDKKQIAKNAKKSVGENRPDKRDGQAGKNGTQAEKKSTASDNHTLRSISVSDEVSTAPAVLKSYATKNKLPSPEFKDLGELGTTSDGRQVFRIECRLSDKSVTADGYSKSDARAIAASKLLELISPDSDTRRRKQKKHAAKSKFRGSNTKEKQDKRAAVTKNDHRKKGGEKGK